MGVTDDIWDSLKDTVGGGDYRYNYPSEMKKKARGKYGYGTYYGKDGKEYNRKKPIEFQSEDQRRFVLATRRGAVTDPEFTPEEASSFIHGVGKN